MGMSCGQTPSSPIFKKLCCNGDTSCSPEGSNIIVPVFDDPIQVCSTANSSCVSVDKLTDKSWSVTCNEQYPNTLNMYSPVSWKFQDGTPITTEWTWQSKYSPETYIRYTNPKTAIETLCPGPEFDDPVVGCQNVPDTCITATPEGLDSWRVKCLGQDDDILHMNNPSEWIWNNSVTKFGDMRTFSDTQSAIRSGCPPFISPSCSGIQSCLSVNPVGSKEWNIKCLGKLDNTLQMISPTEWKYDSTIYSDSTSAIQNACPDIDDPSSHCVDDCFKVDYLGGKQWQVQCKNNVSTVLTANSPTEWMLPNGMSYPEPEPAIKHICPVPQVIPVEECFGNCNSITPNGTNRWIVKGNFGFDNVLLYDSEFNRWLWESYNPMFPETADWYSTSFTALTVWQNKFL
jgi:hypothetical protein